MLSPQAYETEGLALGNAVVAEHQAQPKSTPVAIIGYAGRFPRAENTAQFWYNLDQRVDSVGNIPADRWDGDAYFDERPATVMRTYCNQGGFLKQIDGFDHAFFSISEDEARCMDPKQRLLMHTVYHGLEHAGYGGEAYSGTDTGVFIGSSYSHHEHEMPSRKVISPFGMLGTSNTLLANRISHMFNFQGPSCFIDTFCSSSLMAVHLACQSLSRGECHTALAGGVHLLSLIHYISLSQFRALSATGRCRTFDQAADGFVPGEGVGIVVLKTLQAAIEDGDTIHGVIKGAAVNHTGRSASLTSPSAPSQSRLISTAYDNAGVDFESISYIETHGTGTELGDPLEIKALKAAFKDKPFVEGGCVLGSVKTNIGHLEPASGIAGLIKVLLCLKHKKIPGVLHLNQLNRFINLKDSPFTINTETIDWECLYGTRRAGISSFGLSGTNVHMVVEQPPEVKDSSCMIPAKDLCLYTLSTQSRSGLRRLAGETVHMLDHYSDDTLGDLCFTQAVGRRHFDMRASVSCKSIEELKQRLKELAQSGEDEEILNGGLISHRADFRHEIVIAFGHEFQSAMSDLSTLQPYSAFRQAYNQSMAEVKKCLPADKKKTAEMDGQRRFRGNDSSVPHKDIIISQAIFQLLRSWGLEPVAITGGGPGWIPAALAAGAISWKTALALAEQLKAGSAAEVKMTIEQHPAIPLIPGGVRSGDPCLGVGDRIELIAQERGGIDQNVTGVQSDTSFSTVLIGRAVCVDKKITPPSQSANLVQLWDGEDSVWTGICKGLGRLYVRGASIDWAALYQTDGLSRVPMPTYPFEGCRLGFDKDQGPTIMEMIFNRGIASPFVPASPAELALPQTGASQTIRPEGAGALSAYLIKAVARKTSMAKKELGLHTRFEDIGIDSIMKVELSYDIVEQFSELEQAGNALVAAETLNEFIEIMQDAMDEMPAHFVEGPSDRPFAKEIGLLHAGQKRSPLNLTCGGCRMVDQRLMAELTIDEQHPFFFDHPLDHVSGIHQLEAMLQTVSTAHYALGYQQAHEPLFFRDVHVDFKQPCPKTGPARVDAGRLDFIEGCSDTGLYTANIKSEQHIYCNAFFKIQSLDAHDSEWVKPAVAVPSAARDFIACEKSKVHKYKAANVLISEADSPDDAIPGMTFRIRPVGDHPYFSDYKGEYVPSIYFLEAFRQTQRYLQHRQAADSINDEDRVSFLLSLTLSLERLVGLNEEVSIRIDRVEPKSVGSNLLVSASGRLLQSNVAMGTCRIQNIILTKKQK